MTEHRLSGVRLAGYPAHATGQHRHRRGCIEHDGMKQGYWICEASTDTTTRHCPDEPDPWETLTRKWALEVSRRVDLVEAPPVRRRCTLPGHERSSRTNGATYCLTCHRIRERERAAERRAAAA